MDIDIIIKELGFVKIYFTDSLYYDNDNYQKGLVVYQNDMYIIEDCRKDVSSKDWVIKRRDGWGFSYSIQNGEDYTNYSIIVFREEYAYLNNGYHKKKNERNSKDFINFLNLLYPHYFRKKKIEKMLEL